RAVAHPQGGGLDAHDQRRRCGVGRASRDGSSPAQEEPGRRLVRRFLTAALIARGSSRRRVVGPTRLAEPSRVYSTYASALLGCTTSTTLGGWLTVVTGAPGA